MDVSLNAQTLAAALQPVTRALGRGDAAGSLLLRAANGDLVISAHDGELGIEQRVVVEDATDGQARIDGKLFTDLIKSLPDGDVQLSLEGGQLRIRAGQIDVELRTIIVEHPQPVVPPGSDSIVIDAEAFVSVTEDVQRAASRDESRPMLTGISVTAEDDALTMVATDSYRLAVSRAQMVGGKWNALVPARAMVELVRLVGLTKATTLTIDRSGGGLRASVGNIYLNSRLIDGNFPQYEGLIPASFNHEVEIDTGAMLAALGRMSVLAGRSTPIRLTFSNGQVHVGVEGGDIGRGGETVPCDWSGDDLTVGYNPQYLKEALELAGDTGTLKIVDDVKPSLLVRIDDPNYLMLLMPIRLGV